MLEIFEELDYTAAGLAIAGSLIFIFMIWNVGTWESFKFGSRFGMIDGRIIITIFLPIISYFIVKMQLNR